MRIFDYEDCYMATASTSKCSVWNCYGTTRERAKEMALFRLNQALEDEIKELVVDREGYTFYREK
jgi:ribosomal protein L18